MPAFSYISLYPPVPPFRRAEQHLPGADVHRQNRQLRLSSQAVCNGHQRNVIIEPTQKALEQPWNFPFGRSFGYPLFPMPRCFNPPAGGSSPARRRSSVRPPPRLPCPWQIKARRPLPAACFPFSAALQTETSPKAQSAAPRRQKQRPAPPTRSRPLFHAKRAGKYSRRVAIDRIGFTPTRG